MDLAAGDVLEFRSPVGLVIRGGLVPCRASRRAGAAAGTRDAAGRVAHLLGDLPVSVDDTVAADRVEVVLGRDYTGPTTTTGPPGVSKAVPTVAPAPGDDAPGAPPGDPAITADGTPCVN